jgi:hypothetical protein
MIPFFQGATSGAPAVGAVFATTLWTGNGSNRTITSGIDADLVWIKGRSGATDHALYDTARGATLDLVSNSTAAETTQSTGLTAFGTTGFDLGTLAKVNTNTATYVAWSFARAARFFDVVTYTGTGANRTIAHGLGTTPGLIIVKRRDTGGGSGEWIVYHRSNTANPETDYLLLATIDPTDDATYWNDTQPTSSVFSVGTQASVNASGGTYVAYLFAHDVAADGIVQCGSYTGNGSASGPTVTLGWNPQFVMIKRASGGNGSWVIFDTARGIVAGNDPTLFPSSTSLENGGGPPADYVDLTGTGFQIASTDTDFNNTGDTYVFMAVRSA